MSSAWDSGWGVCEEQIGSLLSDYDGPEPSNLFSKGTCFKVSISTGKELTALRFEVAVESLLPHTLRFVIPYTATGLH